MGLAEPHHKKILGEAQISLDIKTDQLTETQIAQIRKVVDSTCRVEGDLRREISMSIKRLDGFGDLPGTQTPEIPSGARTTDPYQCPNPQRAASNASRQKEKITFWGNYGQRGKKDRQEKKEKKNIPIGIAHIQSTFNNTIMTITDPSGKRGLLGQCRDSRV